MSNVTITHSVKDKNRPGRKRGLTLADLREFLDEADRVGILANEPVKITATWGQGIKVISATAGTVDGKGNRT